MSKVETIWGLFHMRSMIKVLFPVLAVIFLSYPGLINSEAQISAGGKVTYGPHHTSPAAGVPKYAYSPFDEHKKAEEAAASKKHEHMKGRLTIKLAPSSAPGGKMMKNGLKDDDVLNKVQAVKGVKGMKRHFKNAKAPKTGEMITTRDGKAKPKPDLTRWHRIEVDENEDILAKIEELKKIPGIEIAEPDYIRKPSILPGSGTDPLYNQQWHLAATRVPEAWAYLEANGLPPGGSRDVIVAVIDTGIDLNHPDLAANLWTNSVDGTHGRDVITDTNNPMDDHGHGTHVAGIIAAQANNATGGVGIAYNVQIMAIKAAQYSGVLTTSDIAEAIYFAVANGADVINMSFGGYGKSQVEEDALAVAFGQAVLVAAAGNDGKVNLPCPFGADMYPAAYNWVLGVMASNPSGSRASFSNFDCMPHDTHEYELMAPGVGIWSTLPIDQYAAWSGTSMAAPMVSGVAALLRTKFTDKDIYSSRFIMGQIVSNAASGLDAFTALTVAPQPQLNYLEHWLFDTVDQSPTNDNDGVVDAGETIDLAIVIRNHWGKADDVNVQIEPWAEGAFQPDPYVTMLTDTVNYGAIGSFNWDDNGLIYDALGAITGVRNPFKFSVGADTPNNHVIPFRITMTAKNGFDPLDTTVYTTQSRFNLIVQRGRELPRFITTDMTLTKDYFWIVPGQTWIQSGATVTITEGTQVQWGSPDPSCPYCAPTLPYITVSGTLISQGTPSSPVELFPSGILGGEAAIFNNDGGGSIAINYTKIRNPRLGSSDYGYNIINSIDHAYLDLDRTGGWGIGSASFTNSIMHKLQGPFCQRSWAFSPGSVNTSLIDSSWLMDEWGWSLSDLHNSVFLQDNQNNHPESWNMKGVPEYNSEAEAQADLRYSNNAFLSKYWDPNISHWMQFRTYYQMRFDKFSALSQNYWGTLSTTLIDGAIRDFNDDFSVGTIVYQPFLTVPAESTYPFVVDVALINTGGVRTSIVGAEPINFTVTFNRDMDPTVLPLVSFGPDTPMTDYTVHPINGGWQDARTWVGTFNINPITGDGYQLIRVAGARAADDPWLVTGDDAGRFRFEIITSGTEAMNLQATGGEGYVDLMWTQNDFDLLAGYNIYRALSSNGTYTRINTGIIASQTKTFRDTNVIPGQPYYYHFTVVKTDMSESSYSNTATATPLDTIPSVITHTPLTSAQPGLSLSFNAVVTDNVAVTNVKLYFRAIGGTTYTGRTMTKITGNNYSATVEGSYIVSPGIEYYISANDGVSTVTSGRPEYPWQIIVVDKPVVTNVSPVKGPTSGGTAVTISGTNFKTGATVTFGGAVAESVSVVSSSQITCTTPAHFPTVVDVVVTNTDSQTGTLLRGFTFESDVVSLSLPVMTAGQHAIVQVPVNAAGINGLAAADITVAFDPAILTAKTATTGTLSPGWSIASNIAIAGQIRVSMASPGSTVTGSGVLANIEFEVIGTPGTSTAMTISNIKLNDGAIPSITAPGAMNVQMVYSVAGTVGLWKNGSGVAGTQMLLNGDRLYSAQSIADGTYSVNGAPPGSYTLTPSKTSDVNGITAYDASLVLQHAAGLITLSGYESIAADVNKSGSITSMDAFYIMQKAVDVITLPFPGAGTVWDFNPAYRSVTDLSANLTGQNFTAVLLGDVSGNWNGQESIQGGAAVDFRIAEALPAVDGTLTATVSVNPNTQNIYSFDIVLTYDAAKGIPTSVDLGPGAPNWMISYNLSTAGEIRLAMAGALPITSTGNIFTVKFNLLNLSDDADLQAITVLVNESSAANVQYLLGVEKDGTGSGTVTSTTSGINCGAVCSSYYDSGIRVTLDAVSGPDSIFMGWSGACSGTGSCVVNMGFTKNIKVKFADTTPPNAPTVIGTTPTYDTTPSWNWTSGGGGTGTYRYQLNSEAGAWTETIALNFTPTSPLAYGAHTLYVQERDAAGNWSTSGSFAIQVTEGEARTWILVNGVRETCVSSAEQLQACLYDAEADGYPNTIMVVQGTYAGNFIYSGVENFDLSLEGGWDPGCTTFSYNPELTVLDGDLDSNGTGDGVVLDLENTAGGSITVDGIHVKNGYNGVDDGGGIRISTTSGDAEITGTVVSGSTAVDGGGIGVGTGSGNIRLINNIVYGNNALQGGGIAAVTATGTITILNNTVTGNAAEETGGGIAVASGNDTTAPAVAIDITNNIIWSNTAQNTLGAPCAAGDIVLQAVDPADVVVNNNDTSNVCLNGAAFTLPAGNINGTDPLFVNAAGGNYHLSVASPVIDKGNNTHTLLPTKDLYGQERTIGTATDIGADEAGITGEPVLISPNTTIGTDIPTYTWNAVAGATQYRIYLYSTNGNAPLVNAWYTKEQAGCASGTGICSVTPAVSLPDATYRWYMQSKNAAAASSEWSEEMLFTVDTTLVLQSPSGMTGKNTPTFTWNALEGASHYRIYLTNETSPSVPLVNAWYTKEQAGCASGTGTCSIAPITLPDATYKWQMQWKNSLGTSSGWSAEKVFVVDTVPVLISPNTTIGNNTPTFTWNPVAGATQYRIYLINAANPSVPLVNAWYTKEQAGCASGTGTCSIAPITLPDATYKWYMQSKNTLGTGPWSAEKVFAVYTIPVKPKAPTLITPTGTIAQSSPAYTWNAVPGTDSYRIYMANTLNTNSPLVNAWYSAAAAGCAGGVGTCSITPAVTLADADYYWSVKGKNAVGEGPWSANKYFKVLTTTVVPGIPTLVTPSGTGNDSTPTYTWNAVSGATYYRIYVADQGNPNAPLVNVWYTATEAGCAGGTGTCSITPVTALPDAAYNWWIRAKNVAGQGPWSALKSFTVVTTTTIPVSPTLVTPNGTITNATPAFTWNAVSNATSYRIYLTDAANNVELNKWYTATEAGCSSGTGTCSITPALSLTNDSYKWQMQSKNIAGTSIWSGTMFFTKQ